jgi:predicted protein tyrosine phosphatase
VLFVCSRNRRRSPTAEQLFANHPGVETASAGVAPDADEPVTSDLIALSDLIMVMEPIHRRRLQRTFGSHLRHAKIVCLDIRDDYEFMDAALVALLEARVTRHLPSGA